MTLVTDTQALVDAASVDGLSGACVRALSPTHVRLDGADVDLVEVVTDVTTKTIVGPRTRRATVYRVVDAGVVVAVCPSIRAAVAHALGVVVERRVASVADDPDHWTGCARRMIAAARIGVHTNVDAEDDTVYVDALSVTLVADPDTEGDAYVVEAEVSHPGSQWEPPYTDLAEVGSYPTLRAACGALLCALIDDRVAHAPLPGDYADDDLPDVGGAP